MESYDLLIKAALIAERNVQADIAVKDGVVVKIEPEIRGEAKHTIHAGGKIALPAFANMHTHVPMSLLRGIGADLPLMDWLQKVIWPLEGEFVSPEFVRAGTLLGALEMIKSGTTLFMDMYFFEEVVGEVAEEAGLRAGLGFGILDFPTKVARTPEEYLRKAREFARSLKRGRVFPVICPHAPYTCSPSTLTRAKELAEEFNLLLHIHVAETREEVERIKEEYGSTPVRHLENLGFLGSNVLCAHMNLKRGVHVTLGTDGSASNDNLDMLEETATMAKLHKGILRDTKALDARTALRIATENGFSAAGVRAGRLEEGYEADIILLDTGSPHLQPLYDPVAQTVYSAQSSDIDTVICAGRVLMEKREVKTLDEERILHEAKKWGERIREFLRKLG